MVRVENLTGMLGVEPFGGALAPRDRKEPLQVGPDHRSLARLAHPLEATELALGLLANVVGHVGLLDLAAILVHRGAIVLAELLAD